MGNSNLEFSHGLCDVDVARLLVMDGLLEQLLVLRLQRRQTLLEFVLATNDECVLLLALPQPVHGVAHERLAVHELPPDEIDVFRRERRRPSVGVDRVQLREGRAQLLVLL